MLKYIQAVFNYAFPNIETNLKDPLYPFFYFSRLLKLSLSKNFNKKELVRLQGFLEIAAVEVGKIQANNVSEALCRYNALIFFERAIVFLEELKSPRALLNLVFINKKEKIKYFLEPLINILAVASGNDIQSDVYKNRLAQFFSDMFLYNNTLKNKNFFSTVAGLKNPDKAIKFLSQSSKNFIRVLAVPMNDVQKEHYHYYIEKVVDAYFEEKIAEEANRMYVEIKHIDNAALLANLKEKKEAYNKIIADLRDYSIGLGGSQVTVHKLKGLLSTFLTEVSFDNNNIAKVKNNIKILFKNRIDQVGHYNRLLVNFIELSSKKVISAELGTIPADINLWLDYISKALVSLTRSLGIKVISQQLVILLKKVLMDLPGDEQSVAAESFFSKDIEDFIKLNIDSMPLDVGRAVELEAIKKSAGSTVSLSEIKADATMSDRYNFVGKTLIAPVKNVVDIISLGIGEQNYDNNINLEPSVYDLLPQEKLIDIAKYFSTELKKARGWFGWAFYGWNWVLNKIKKLFKIDESIEIQLENLAKQAENGGYDARTDDFVKELEKFIFKKSNLIRPSLRKIVENVYNAVISNIANEADIEENSDFNNEELQSEKINSWLEIPGKVFNICTAISDSNKNIAVLVPENEADKIFQSNIISALNDLHYHLPKLRHLRYRELSMEDFDKGTIGNLFDAFVESVDGSKHDVFFAELNKNKPDLGYWIKLAREVISKISKSTLRTYVTYEVLANISLAQESFIKDKKTISLLNNTANLIEKILEFKKNDFQRYRNLIKEYRELIHKLNMQIKVYGNYESLISIKEFFVFPKGFNLEELALLNAQLASVTKKIEILWGKTMAEEDGFSDLFVDTTFNERLFEKGLKKLVDDLVDIQQPTTVAAILPLYAQHRASSTRRHNVSQESDDLGPNSPNISLVF